MKLYLLTLVFFLNVAHLNAEDIDVTQSLRINQLMPRERLLIRLAVEPAIPEDYIALSKEGEVTYSDWVYWGPKDILSAYFKDPLSLSVPIIRVKTTPNIIQPRHGVLDEKSIREGVSQMDKKASLDFGSWGTYPYCMIGAKKEKAHMAYVGLNDENGTILFFHLIIPQNELAAEASALKLWKRFFQETKELPEPLFFKALGQEMHPGYTIVDVVGRKIKVIAEKRKSDQKIQFIAIPIDQNIEFKFETAFTTLMTANWHYNEPLLKIKGAYIINKGWLHYSMTTSVFIKEVDEFTHVAPVENVFFKAL